MNIDELTQETKYMILQPVPEGWQNESGETCLASDIVKIANNAFTAGTVLYICAEYTREVVPYLITKENKELLDLLIVLAKARNHDRLNTKEWTLGFNEGHKMAYGETTACTAQMVTHLSDNMGSEMVTPEFLAGAMFGAGWILRGLA